MSKLQILIPQYNETPEIIKPLLDSIAIQQNLDFNDIEVFIGNDGSDTKLPIDFLKQYSYRIQYHYFEHGGLAATRQKLQHLATADFIMFCDADDCFISTIGLSVIIKALKPDTDAIICDFMEEGPNAIYIPHHDDSVFVHGKIYRRQFLLDNKIEWNPTLREHQDSAFNVLARTLAKRTQLCTIPLYMWHYNPNSVCRHDGIYHSPNTWCAMIDSYRSIVSDFSKRGMGSHAMYYAVWCLYATYYEMAHEVWKGDKVDEQKIKTYKKITEFFFENELLIRNLPDEKAEEISKRTKALAEKKGKLTDMPPFEEWLQSIIIIWRG